METTRRTRLGLVTLGLALCVVIAPLSSEAQEGKLKRAAQENAQEAVREWLEKAPLDDGNHRGRRAVGPSFTYEAWFREGRALAQVTDVLVMWLGQAVRLNRATPDAFKYAYALGWVGNESATATLLKALEVKADTRLRSEAASALGRLRAKAVFPKLKALAKDTKEDQNVRASACVALGYMRHEGSKDVLTLLSKDGNGFVADSAKAGLDLLSLTITIELTSARPPVGKVVVRNESASSTAVWKLGNEWGDNALSFEIHGEVVLRVARKAQIYTRNVPSAHKLGAGESHAWEFDLGDGTWELGEHPDWDSATNLAVVYETLSSTEASTARVWIGRAVSEPTRLKAAGGD